MHPLHDYVARLVGDRLRARKIVVWYDGREEFASFVAEIRGALRLGGDPVPVVVDGVATRLVEYAGSMFEIRAAVEGLVCGDVADSVLIYVPGYERDSRVSPLMELEKAGDVYEVALKRLARNILRQRYTDGVVDEILAPERVTYEDLARAASETGAVEPPSILKSIFHEASGSDGLLAAWLVSDARDAEIAEKEATRELVKLVRSRLGFELPGETPLEKLRAATLRYALAGEFRSDLSCPPPACLEGVPGPRNKEEEAAVRDLARRLRTGFAEAYPALADRVEAELGLGYAQLPAGGLGAIDTFRFEERALVGYCGELIANGKFDAALEIVAEREHSFWLDRELERKAQWKACRYMADLGRVAAEVRAAVAKGGADASTWIDGYSGTNGWYRLDQAQRRLETWVARLEDEPEERPLGVVRRAYEEACHAMADGFSRALLKGGWALPTGLHQTDLYGEVVSARPKPVAYFLVDAMRYEMGVELSERLPKAAEVSLRPAVGALPGITTIGMAALQPAASGSFSVVAQGGKLGARIEGAFLPDLAARKKFAASRVPELVDIGLDALLGLSPSKLKEKIAGAQVIVVRSQEIDQIGEVGLGLQARQVMDTVIDNLCRGIRKLVGYGIEHSVVTADHGHLFFSSDRDESMRTDPPGGETVQLHRRCWIGRGGQTPTGCVRVRGAELGYDTDLEFVFPTGCGVFRAGGDLAYYHGGLSLQEIVIPVVTVRMTAPVSKEAEKLSLEVRQAPEAITNRIFSVRLLLGKKLSLFAPELPVRAILLSEGRQVGQVCMVVDASVNPNTGIFQLRQDIVETAAFMLTDESAKSLRIVIQDPATDAELYRSPAEIPVRLGV